MRTNCLDLPERDLLILVSFANALQKATGRNGDEATEAIPVASDATTVAVCSSSCLQGDS